MRIEISDELEDLVYIVAALGRISDPLRVELYEMLYDTLTIGEKHRAEKLMKEMKFS